MKISFISSSSSIFEQELLLKIESLVNALNKIPKLEICTGGSSGIPGELIKRAHILGMKTIVYSPDPDSYSHHKRDDNLTLDQFSEVKHITGFTARSLAMIQDSDAVVMMNGRIGTLSEATIALEEGKYLAILTGTLGVADHMEYILNIAKKEFPGKVFFSNSPEEIVSWISKLGSN